MKGLAVALGVVLLGGCATRPSPVGYFSKPDAQADQVMVEDAVTQLWPHCTNQDYGTIQFDSRLSGNFVEWLKAGMVQRGCHVLSVAPPNPAGTTIVGFLVDALDDERERRLTLVARGFAMSRLYTKADGQWLPVGVWSVGAATIKR